MITNSDTETLQSFLNSMQGYNMDELKSLGLNFDHGLTATADPNMVLMKRSPMREEPELTPMQPSTPPDQRVPSNPPGPSTSPAQVVAKRSQPTAQNTTSSAPPNGKKTKGRVKIKMEFINNKLRRYTTFSKRKTGIMKKAYELSTLTGTQVMLLVASETGHVYTFATRKLQPMITSESGKQLIQTCLNSPDESIVNPADQRMAATGYEETDLSYNILNQESSCEDVKGESTSSDEEEEEEEERPEPRKKSKPTPPGTSAIEHTPQTIITHPPQAPETLSNGQPIRQAIMLPNGTILITDDTVNQPGTQR